MNMSEGTHTTSSGRAGLSARGVLLLCLLTVVFEGYDMVAYGAALPAMFADAQWNLDAAQAGAVGSYGLIGMLVGSLITGALADRIGRRVLTIASTAWFSAWMGVCGIAPNITVFGFGRFMVGVGVGAVIPLAASLAVEFAPAERNIATAPACGQDSRQAESSPRW